MSVEILNSGEPLTNKKSEKYSDEVLEAIEKIKNTLELNNGSFEFLGVESNRNGQTLVESFNFRYEGLDRVVERTTYENDNCRSVAMFGVESVIFK